MDEAIKVRADVPTTSIVVANKEQASKLVRRMAGEQPPDECHLHCIMCGWSETLHFTPDELEALDGNAENYTGPCPGFEKDDKGKTAVDDQGNPIPCGCMTLQPIRKMSGASIDDMARDSRKREFREQAEVQAEVIIEKGKQAVSELLASTMASPAPVVDQAAEPPVEPKE